MDISINIGNHRFNYRVSAIIIRNNEILVHRNIDSNNITLPGGRVKAGENSLEVIQREIKEEMGYETELVKEVSFIENFFKARGEDYHEILVTYELKFKDKLIYNKEKILPIEPEKKDKLEFLWYDIQTINNTSFVPKSLINVIKENKEFVHKINDERR